MSMNTTGSDFTPPYDIYGSIMYIVGVLVWYAIGFGLILIDDVDPQAGYIESRDRSPVSQTVTDLYEHQALNEILLELKDKDRRTRLWQIYYGTQSNPTTTVKKEKEAIELIVKQLNDLSERRRLLRSALNEISVDQSDSSDDVDLGRAPSIRKSRSSDQLRRFVK